jgi:decaprenylphospho-beta-D-ribofuranose 2-oxidase
LVFMPAPELLATRPQHAQAVSATIRGWGGGQSAAVSLLRPQHPDDLDLAPWRARGAIPRGMGRSYGDAAQLSDGFVIETTLLKGFELDRQTGIVTAQAGVTIGELLDASVPAGWMVPVVPGTQHVTIGGAIASDIHGKNHGTAGTFGSYVRALGLLTASGETIELTPDSELFRATVGGIGLTGVILWARIELRAVRSALLSVDTDRATGLDHALELLGTPGGPHRVAWLDLLGARPGRGIVTRAEHLDPADAPVPARARPTVKSRAAVPDRWPAGVLRVSTVSVFNEIRYRRAPRRERGRIESLGSHMFPLDALDDWPRLYGRHGLVQYQLVVPPGSERVLEAVIEHLRRSRVPCFLAVLKDFGPANDAHLSFPIAGWTLALDLPRAAPGLAGALDRCDELVAEAGGRVYLTKDSRLRPATVAAMYPRLEAWRAVRERSDPHGLWRSDLGLRTGLVSR